MSWGSYGLGVSLSTGAPDVPLFASVAASANPLGNDQVLVRERDSGRTIVLTLQVLQALDLCREFAPMDQHVERVCAQLSGLQGQQAAVRGVLQDLAHRGLLKRADDWLGELSATSTHAPAPFRTLIIRTCERPETLVALLESLRDHEQRWAKGHRHVLVDMSRDPEIVQRNREALAAFHRATGCPTAHVDRARQQRYLGELSEALPEHAEGLRYLLGDCGSELGFHGDYGVSLNWMHLLGAGERYVLLDDDHLFPLRWHPESTTGVDLADQAEPARLFASLEDALAWGREPDSDPLATHAAACGQPLGSLLASGLGGTKASALRGLAPSRLPQLKADSHVLASTHGHRGDTCSLSLMWLLTLPAAARPPGFADPQRYRAALQRPAVAQVASRFRRLGTCGLTPFMVDGSRLMPAVPPRGRGEDGVFCALLETLHKDSLLLELPLSIGHRRPSAPDRGGFVQRPVTPALAQVLTDQLRYAAVDLQGSDVRARLRAACSQLEALAETTDAEASAYLQGYLLDCRARWMAGFRHALKEVPSAPAHWVADLQSLIEANGRALLDGAPARFAEWPADIDAASGAALWRGYLSRFAAALRGWPDAIEFARARAPHWIQNG